MFTFYGLAVAIAIAMYVASVVCLRIFVQLKFTATVWEEIIY